MTGPTATPVDMLAELVAFDTTSANSNLQLIDHVADYLSAHGVEPIRVFSDDGRKANLFATIGPPDQAGVILSGHTDTVPVTGQAWDSDPFDLTTRGDRLFGRGTADMKGFIACVLSLVPELLSRPLRTPLHIALSYDEEVGCLGAPRLIERICRDRRPLLAIVGEPTGMMPHDAHKGISVHTTIVTGRDGHSGKPAAGVNAITYAAELIAFLDRLARQLARAPATDTRFDPPGTTLNVGTIAGGTAINIIARECHFRWECRTAPDSDPAAVRDALEAHVEETVLPRMRAVDPATSVETVVECAAPPLARDAASPAARLIRHLTGDDRTGAASFICEAGLFSGAGIPAIICGPGHIAQAHQPNEYIETAQLEACTALLRRLADWAESGAAP